MKKLKERKPVRTVPVRLVSQAEKEVSERAFIETTRKIQIGEAGVQTPAELACESLLANTCQLTGPVFDREAFLNDDDPMAEEELSKRPGKKGPVSKQLTLWVVLLLLGVWGMSEYPTMVAFGYAWLAPAIAASAAAVQELYQSRQRRKEYERMKEYNAPKAQMARFQDAGLSPYLMYGQGTAGNVTEPAPVESFGADKIGNAIGDYIGVVNAQNMKQRTRFDAAAFPFDLSLKRNQSAATQYASDITAEQATQERYKSIRAGLELMADFDEQALSGVNPLSASRGFRAKINELKRSLAEAQVEQVNQTVAGLRSRNIVDAVKARYANEFGMVGGDWTQGLGLIKSTLGRLSTFRRGGGKVTHELENVMKTGRRTIRRRTYER